MPNNRAFWRAIHSLTHPVAIAAIVVLLVNDHWLRHQSPSWLTGKLGDFSWLVFAPLIAAASFALVLPGRTTQHARRVGLLAFATIGLWFALAKTVPPVYLLTKAAWEGLIGWPGTLRIDPSDLVTLPALLVGWWVWGHADDSPLSLRPLAYVAVALGLFATLASDYPSQQYIDKGVSCIFQEDDQLVILGPRDSFYPYIGGTSDQDTEQPGTWTYVYTSTDGGLSWQDRHIVDFAHPSPDCEALDGLTDPNNSDIKYRWRRGQTVEYSNDGGTTWTVDYNLDELHQNVRQHYNHYHDSRDPWSEVFRVFVPGPLHGVIDEETGNVVLAMSWDGVLVRTADGTWQWVDVGQYGLADLTDPGKILTILFFEWWLAGALAFLIVTSAAAYMRTASKWRWGLLVVGWLGWMGITIYMIHYHATAPQPENYVDIGLCSFILLVFLAIPMSIGAVWDILHNFRAVALHIALPALIAPVLFLLPHLLWVRGTIGAYTTALVFSLLLTGAGLAFAYLYLRPRLPVVGPSKRKKREPEPENDTITA